MRRAWCSLVVLIACASPRIVEDSAAACSNGLDDDGNGLVDCADPACAKSGACEAADAASCSNGLDDDGDGRIDCEQQSCIAAGLCEQASADCDVVHDTGCVRGMSCEATDRAAGTPRVCARPGVVEENHICDFDVGDAAGGCKSGTVCYALNLCARPCEDNLDCPRSSTCIRGSTQPYGVCSLTCFPATGCVVGYSCVALQRLGTAYAAGGWMHTCVDAIAAEGFAAMGAAKVGDPCIDAAVTTSPPAMVCASGLICVPEPMGNVCREVCLANPDGRVATTCASGGCVAIDPYDARPARPTELYRFGVCEP